MRSDKGKQYITVTLPEKLAERLERLATEKDISFEEFVSAILEDQLESLLPPDGTRENARLAVPTPNSRIK